MRHALAKRDRGLRGRRRLTAMRRGFEDHAEHRHADAIRLTSLSVAEDLPKVAFTSGGMVDRVERLAFDAMPFLEWGWDIGG